MLHILLKSQKSALAARVTQTSSAARGVPSIASISITMPAAFLHMIVQEGTRAALEASALCLVQLNAFLRLALQN